jgi:hypothetical protein
MKPLTEASLGNYMMINKKYPSKRLNHFGIKVWAMKSRD